MSDPRPATETPATAAIADRRPDDDVMFAVDPDARTLRGLLLPYDEMSSPSISGTEPVMFAKGTVALPADPMIATLYDGDHDRFEPRGRAVSLEDTDEGIVATFSIARTPEGDALLKRAQETPRPRLSAEIKGLVRRGAQAVKGALTGASIVTQGAFESAALFAALGDVVEAEPTTETAPVVEAEPEGTEPEDNTQEAEMADAVVPGTLHAPGSTEKDKTSADGLFAALASSRGNPGALEAYAGGDAMFAISNIQDSGPSGATIGKDTSTPRYLGELWTRQPYQRRYVPLLSHDTLTSTKAVGWKFDYANDKAPQVGDYSGNASEIPSNAVDTVQVSVDASRIAGGHKLDRRFIDFNDQAVIAAYFREMGESVARQTDAKALASIISAATALDVTALDAPSTSADAVAPGLVAVVDAALQVIATENRPAYGLVSSELWREIILRPKDATLEYLRAAFGLEDGEVANFRLLPANVGTGKVIVGAREAITFFELGGTAPIRVEGIDPHHGAIDPAVFAYWAALTNNSAAVVSVDTATYGTAA